MIVYYFNDFENVGEAEIQLMMPIIPSQQIEAIISTKLLSRKREIAISNLMLAYALKYNHEEIHSDSIIIKQFTCSEIASTHDALSLLLKDLNNSQNVDEPILKMRIAEHGKPYLIDHDDIYFNISHCKQAIVTAVSNYEIGVDAEGRRRYSNNLMERAYNDAEITAVLHSNEPEKEFARIWTRKEAFFKWTGTGILIDHIKSVEQDAAAARCKITTQQVIPEQGEMFFLSIAKSNM